MALSRKFTKCLPHSCVQINFSVIALQETLESTITTAWSCKWYGMFSYRYWFSAMMANSVTRRMTDSKRDDELLVGHICANHHQSLSVFGQMKMPWVEDQNILHHVKQLRCDQGAGGTWVSVQQIQAKKRHECIK